VPSAASRRASASPIHDEATITSACLLTGDPLAEGVGNRQHHGIALPFEDLAGCGLHHPAIGNQVARLGQRQAGEQLLEGLDHGLVLRLEEAYLPPALYRHMVARRHVVDPVELEHLSHHDEPAEHLLEESEPGILLGGERPPVGSEMGARILQQQPLDYQHFGAAHQPRASVDPQVHQQLAAVRIRVDPQSVADAAREVHLDRRMLESAQSELVEETKPLQQKLYAVL